MSKKCPNCGSDNSEVVIKFVDGGICCKCNDCGELFILLTLFANITASPEVLAESVVYHYEMAIGGSTFRIYWTSPFVENFYPDKSEALAATVAKLKEVCDE